MKFIEKYWFSNLQMVTVRNPFKGDIVFMHEMRTYAVKEASEARLPGSIANLYLDLVSRTLAQQADDLGAIGDPEKCGSYYDQIIISVEDSMPEYDTATGFAVKTKESTVAPTQPFQSEDFEPPALETKVEQPRAETLKPGDTHEFMLGEDAYALVMGENDVRNYLKNGNPIEVGEYSKAMSML